jgi:23S rRNA (adenine2503-C2)-methyltransferase
MSSQDQNAAQHPVERTPEQWSERLAEWDQPKYRGLQIFRWIHQRGVMDPNEMSDLPKALRAKLIEDGLASPVSIDLIRDAIDGTRKVLVALHDDRKIESVLIPRGSAAQQDIYTQELFEGQDDETPGVATPSVFSQCISTQVGCAMGCGFCASGIAGLKRNLTAAEIVSQVLIGKRELPQNARLAGIVFMGMGEPLHNYGPVAQALRLISHPEGIGLSLKRVTLSTSGLVEGIEKLGRDFGGAVNLAISLHAATDETRTRIMPINKRHPLSELMPALRAYPLPPRRRITIEYTLIEGVNDSHADARALVKLVRGMRVKVNLIPMNRVPDALVLPGSSGGLSGSEPKVVDAFQNELRGAGIDAFVRKRKGDDIAAACGQLALSGEKAKVRRLSVRPA